MHRTFAVAFLLTLSAVIHAQEGGVRTEFCTGDEGCIDDALELIFANGTSTYDGPVADGTEVPIQVVMNTRTSGIQGWSYAVRHDPSSLSIIEDSATTAGTIAHPDTPGTVARPPNFDIVRVTPDGFFSVVVLSFSQRTELPPDRRNIIFNAAYTLGSDPACTVLEFADRFLVPGNSLPLEIKITVDGESWRPRTLVHGLFSGRRCAEICNDGEDNDGDGQADCDDTDCDGHTFCLPPEECGDGVDNDGDGQTDCDDTDCRTQPHCQEDCGDGLDNDLDGLVDCADSDCTGNGACLEDCDDGLDNDLDGLADCDDDDCAARCQDEICGDGLDNDLDLFIDCQDLDCEDDSACPVPPGGSGGTLVELCAGESACIDDTLEIVFENETSTFEGSLFSGLRIPIEVVLDTHARGIQGWSYAVRHDADHLTLDADSVTTEGTLADPAAGVAMPPGFDSTMEVSGGFISAVVLSFTEPTELPVGKRNVICRAAYDVRRSPDPAGTLIEIADGEIAPAESPPVAINVTVAGVAKRPRFLRQGEVRPSSTPPEVCDDEIDNDSDGFVDCDDPDCEAEAACDTLSLFQRGDVTGDGRLNISDVVVVIRLALGTREPVYDCRDAVDTNDDGSVNITDAIPVLFWLFGRGQPLPAPFLACGSDSNCREPSPACR